MSGSSFVHRFEEGRSTSAPLLVLHGTGGNEDDLIPLAKTVAPERALLSPRGKVLENGMPRFFGRFAEGAFDEEDVRLRANELADFVLDSRSRYKLPAPIAFGYSNGANIAAAVMLLRPEVLAGGILLRSVLPLSDVGAVHASGGPDLAALIVSGSRDSIAPEENGARLAATLQAAGVNVEHKVIPATHQISQLDVGLARGWLEAR